MEHEVDIHEAMLNSYDVLINQIDYEDVIERNNGWFAHDVWSPITVYNLENILFYIN